jgi:predicted RNA methylase
MPDAAQYTLGLFDTSALGWTVDIPRATAASPEPIPPVHDSIDDTRVGTARPLRGTNCALGGDRPLARGWPARARDNIRAITLSKEIEDSGRAPTRDEQAELLRFIGFGATDLAQSCFPLPGAEGFRDGWQQIGESLAAATTPAEYSALQRATQYARYTPEPIIRAIWRAVQRLGFAGGRVLEPGMGTGLFFALMPVALREITRLTGIEYDPISARIARLLHPEARIHCEDYTRSRLGGGFDLAIGNPPFADRIVRGDPRLRTEDALGNALLPREHVEQRGGSADRRRDDRRRASPAQHGDGRILVLSVPPGPRARSARKRRADRITSQGYQGAHDRSLRRLDVALPGRPVQAQPN